MRVRIERVAILLGSILLAVSSLATAGEPPVAKLVQVEGNVQYSRDGDTWRAVRGTKYLFSGYQIKTGADGGGRVVNEETGMSRELGANSLIKVMGQEISVVAGTLSAPKEESTTLFESLSNKFAKAQRYTTVRRSADRTACDPKVRTIDTVTLSSEHPDLVWRNACPEYSYRLVIDGSAHDIPAASTAEMIRYSVKGISAGSHQYHVEVLDNDGTVYIPREDSTFVMLSDNDAKKLDDQLSKFQDDVFQRADVLETNGMYVAAMDAYRSYFKNNPDDNDMRPLLIAAYQELRLSNLRESEARLYNASIEESY